MTMELEPYDRNRKRADTGLSDVDKTMLDMRRRGLGPDQIAEEMGFDSRFDVIERLNGIYTYLNASRPNARKLNIEAQVDYVDTKIEDLVTTFQDMARDGDYKAGRLVLQALELKAKIHGAITPPQVNVQINNERPWQTVYAATLSDEVVDGEVVEDEQSTQS